VIWWLGGEFHAAEPPIQRALAAAGTARDDRLRARIAASWANLVLATEDRVDEAMALADVAETWATDPTALVGWRTARARALVRIGDAETADRLGRQAVSLAEQTDSTDLRANALLHLAEVLRLSDRPAEALPFQRRALRILDRKGATAQAAAIFRQLGSDVAEPPGAAAPPSPDELRADDDLEPGASPGADPGGPEPLIDPVVPDDTEHPAAEPHDAAAAEPQDGPAEVADAGEGDPDVMTSDPIDTPPAQPIASSFAASADGDRKKKGLFRR
jgi:tetratricopeptide (TPR) repeat protein